MTQEEKAKAYDKALEKIKYVMEHGVSPTLNKEDLQDIFPELKESEDERIRKTLIDYMASVIDINGIKGETIIAWLEKQGEQKWSEEDEKHENTIIRAIHGAGNITPIDGELAEKWLKSLKQRLEEQKDVTPADVGLAELGKVWEEKVKSKWTDEDEAHLHSVTTHLGQWIERHPNTCGADIQCENLAWLKSLKQRMQ